MSDELVPAPMKYARDQIAKRSENDLGNSVQTVMDDMYNGESQKKRRMCALCRAGYTVMTMANKLLVNGSTVKDVHQILMETVDPSVFPKGKVPSYSTVLYHSKNHLPSRDAAYRRIIEQRALEANKDIERGADNLLTAHAVAEMVMKRGTEAILSGETTPSVKETLEASKLFNQFEHQADQSLGAAEATVMITYIMQAVQNKVPKELFPAIIEEIERLKNAGTEGAYVIDEEYEDYDES